MAVAHRNLNTLIFTGFEPTTAATVISLLGDEGMPPEIRIVNATISEPWQSARSGLMVLGISPMSDLVMISQLLRNRTTYWEVVVSVPSSLSYFGVALLAQGALKVISHPEEDLEACRNELRIVLKNLATQNSDAFGLEVADLIQLYGEKRVPKTIRLTASGCIGSIYLENGNIVHAETMDEESGMEAFRRLMSLRSPEVRVHKGCLTDQRTLGLPAMTALLESSRQIDEANRPRTGSSEFDSLDDVSMTRFKRYLS